MRSLTVTRQNMLSSWTTGTIQASRRPCSVAGRPEARRACRRQRSLRSFASTSDKIKTTLSDLDAILGIDEEKENEEKAKQDKQQQAGKAVDVSISPDVVATLAQAESERASASGSNPETDQALKQQIERLAEAAKRLADSNGKADTAGEQALKKEFDQLASMLTGQGINHEDVKLIKETVFKRSTFWVTEAKALPGILGGILVRGNLKVPTQAAFEEVCAATEEALGSKYVVRVVPDPEASDMEPPREGAPSRVAFEFLPSATSLPQDSSGWQRVAAGALLLFTMASTVQLGLGANLGLLPKETLLWLSNPANLNADVLPPGLDTYDPLPFLQSTLDVCLLVLLPQLAHELGHSVVAAIKKIKIEASYLIPNSQLGTLGSVTQFKSFVRNRSDLFDFSVGGLAAGGVVSLALFLGGLVLSHGGSTAEAGLIPVPSQLFQGSLFLGGLARLGFGADVIAQANVYVHPALIGGWCGLVAMALNSLPCGNLDGGRSMLASFGRDGLAVSSILTYIGLGFQLVGSSLAWPFGIYLLICQRESERYIQDEVSAVSDQRRTVSAALIVLALLILVPMGPGVADLGGVGTPSNFL